MDGKDGGTRVSFFLPMSHSPVHNNQPKALVKLLLSISMENIGA
jgi:hypothetical protein